MADDLDDEWWLEDKDVEDTEPETKGKKRRLKRNKDKHLDGDNENKGKVKKKRKKPKFQADPQPNYFAEYQINSSLLVVESINTEFQGLEAPKLLWTTFCDCTEGSLSTLELEDVMIDDSCCLVDDSTHTGSSDELLPYLNTVIPHWTGHVAKLDKRGDAGSPLLLFISSAATRLVELNRSAVEFKGNCKTVKLFAKHMKMSAQEQFLESHVVHFGIGTPSRILKLLQNDSLKTSRLKYVILDWTWRDQKLRRMVDIPEVREELVSLLKEFIFPLAKASKLKIGLF